MAVAAASLANLKPPFERGNIVHRKSRDVISAISRMRKGAKDAVEYCMKVLHDEDEDTANRVRVALALIDKVIPDATANDQRLLAASGAAMLRIEIIDPDGVSETVTIRPAEPQKLGTRSQIEGETLPDSHAND